MTPDKIVARNPRSPGKPGDTPFGSSAEAWFWTVSALRARRSGERATSYGARLSRPCEPDDVVRCVQDLMGAQILGRAHAEVLQDVGTTQIAPDPSRGHAAKLRLWREALDRMDAPLRRKGIVG